ncbi:MAG TPA: VanR-ABDEGLN family DNA-binding response regulator [Erysipelotrichaceae bacterium]|nr:VanR-ABDEGLN family DNA-binding response regulator [Erysipelotrichaceae bacterium]
MNEKILVMDDEREITDLVELYLKNEGYEVIKAYDGEEALRIAESEDLSLAVLDVMVPGIDGFEVCRRIREKYYYPIILLTARVEDIDKIQGLTIGADDYITKPFNPLELTARVKTQLRRWTRYNGHGTQDTDSIDIRGLHISKSSHTCTLNGKDLSLTPIEFSILLYLCEHQGSVVSSEQLFEAVWKEKYFNSNNTVMVHIARIREKMHEPERKPKYVKTVWGIGYTIE